MTFGVNLSIEFHKYFLIKGYTTQEQIEFEILLHQKLYSEIHPLESIGMFLEHADYCFHFGLTCQF